MTRRSAGAGTFAAWSSPFVLGLGAAIFLGTVAWLVTFPVSITG